MGIGIKLGWAIVRGVFMLDPESFDKHQTNINPEYQIEPALPFTLVTLGPTLRVMPPAFIFCGLLLLWLMRSVWGMDRMNSAGIPLIILSDGLKEINFSLTVLWSERWLFTLEGWQSTEPNHYVVVNKKKTVAGGWVTATENWTGESTVRLSTKRVWAKPTSLGVWPFKCVAGGQSVAARTILYATVRWGSIIKASDSIRVNKLIRMAGSITGCKQEF